MLKITIADQSFEVTPPTSTDEPFLLNGEPTSVDIQSLGGNHFHVIRQNKSFQAEVVKTDADTKTVEVKVNGRSYAVQVKDRFDQLLDRMGLKAAAGAAVNEVKAPMPGLILSIQVQEGAEVKQGDTLLILEAMKMENVIKAPGDGTVRRIAVAQGDSVDKNHVLIQF